MEDELIDGDKGESLGMSSASELSSSKGDKGIYSIITGISIKINIFKAIYIICINFYFDHRDLKMNMGI